MKKLLLPVLSLIVFASMALSVGATTLVVTNTGDSGAGSLRDAISAAIDGETIQFAAGLHGQVITLTSAHLFINKNLTIDGPGANLLTVTRSTAGGTPNFRIFRIAPSHTVTIRGLTISNGISPSGSVGGGVFNDGSMLTIANCVVSGNSAAFGGGIYSDTNQTGSANLTINNSIVSGNSASANGGGILNNAPGDLNFGSIELNDSTISGNSAASGGGIFNDAYFRGNAFLIIKNTTISGNTAAQTGSGGGIYNYGEFQSRTALVSVSNSTISGNSAGSGGGIFNNGDQGIATLQILDSTISDNAAGQGGGIFNIGSSDTNNGAILSVRNTILKAGASGENIHNALGRIYSSGYNLSSDNGGGFLNESGDQINTDPMLGPLQDNGGPTFTHELLLGSPALNAGNPSFSPPPDFDQRGPGFPRIFNTRVDIGSFELQAIAPIPTPSPPPTASPTPTATATAIPSATPTPTAIPSATPTPTAIPSATPTPTSTPTPSTRLLNISTRLRVQTADNALIGGFIITGNAPKRALIRAIGPSLTSLGIPGALSDPALELHGPGGFITIMNNDWRDTQEAEIEGTGIAPPNEVESAIVAMLPPGAYSAIVRGNDGGTGVGLIEAYDLASGADAQLANISTRGFVESGDNVMIGGFILGNGSANAMVLIRAIGPSLTPFGVPDALTDPTLELRNNNGALVAANDDWRDTQEAEIEGTGIPPSDDRESAILQDLAPSAYTAIVRGKNGMVGVAVVEAYRLATAP